MLKFYIFLLYFYVVASQSCREASETCNEHKDCCGGCCMKYTCRETYWDCRRVDDPCLDIFCPPDQECYIYQPQDCGGCGPTTECRDSGPVPDDTTITPQYSSGSTYLFMTKTILMVYFYLQLFVVHIVN